jgi:hypothetical protein
MSGAGSTSPLRRSRRARLIGGRTAATMRGDGTAAALAAEEIVATTPVCSLDPIVYFPNVRLMRVDYTGCAPLGLSANLYIDLFRHVIKSWPQNIDCTVSYSVFSRINVELRMMPLISKYKIVRSC